MKTIFNLTKQYILLIGIYCLPSSGFTQNISFLDIDAGQICQESELKMMITNSSGIDLSDSEVEIRLHCGATYVPNSIIGGMETLQIDPSEPKFSISNLSNGESREITLKFTNSCITKDCIDSGEDIAILALWTVGSDTYSTASPSLSIKTANLLFTNLTNTFVELIESNRFDRVMKIKNTRLGALKEFTITETYDRLGYQSTIDGVSKIDSVFGLNIYSISNEIIRQFGDGDDLFEFGEEITLINNVVVDICPFDVKNIACSFSLDWGCDMRRCQFERRKCAIKLKPPILIDEILEYEVLSNLPQCFYNQSVKQGVLIRNTSAFTKATTLRLSISNGLLTGIIDGSIQLTGVDSFTVEYMDEKNIDCDGQSYSNAKVIIDVLDPGEELLLEWTGDFCDNEQCDFLSYFWNVRYSYIKDCAASIDAVKAGSIPFSWSKNLGNIDMSSFITGDRVLTDGAMLTIENEYSSSNFIDGQGFVDIAYNIPCGMELLSTNLAFGGVEPLSTELEDLGSESKLTIRYPKPLNGVDLGLNLDFQFNCDSTCNRELCTTVFAGSCSLPCFSLSTEATIKTEITIYEDNGCEIMPKIVDSITHFLGLECGVKACIDSLPGWVEQTLTIQRKTKGLTDSNDDGIPDNDMLALDDSISLNRAMIGDTIDLSVNGIVHVDFNTPRINRLFLQLRGIYKGISPDINLIKGPIEFRSLFSEEGFPLIQGDGVIVKATSGERYMLSGLSYSRDTTLGTFILDLSVDSLHMQDFVPAGFRFEEGDSISLRLRHRIDYNVKSTNFIEIIPSVISCDITSVFGFDETVVSDYESKECYCSTDDLEVTSLQFAGSKFGFYEPDDRLICIGDQAEFRKFLSGYGVRKGFFPNEYRSIYIPKTISFEEQEYTNIDAVILEFKDRLGSVVYNDTITNWEDIDDRKFFEFPDMYFDEYAQINWKFRIKVDKDISCKTEAFRTNEAYAADILLEQERPYIMSYGRDSIYCLGAEMSIQVPKMEFEFDVDFSQSFSDSVGWEFYLFNKNPRAPILNPYVKLIDSDFYSDLKIISLESGSIYRPDINGYIQLPSFEQDSMKYLITGKLSSCNPQQISLELGWDCDKLSSTEETPCFVREYRITGEVPPPTSEVDLSDAIAELVLCDSSEYINFKLINAGLGLMVEPELKTILPAGMEMVAGSGQRFDPTIGSFVPVDWLIDDREIIWNLTTNNGLSIPGIDSEPDNEIEFRFKVKTDCDFISGSVIAVEFFGQHVCGAITNSVRRISPPFNIQDIDQGMSIPLAGVANVDACSNAIELILTINKSFTSIDNGVFVQFPFEFEIVEDEADIIGTIQGPELVYILPNEPYSNTWRLTVRPLEGLECGSKSILLNATTNAKANCLSSNDECDIKTVVNSFLVDFNIEKPRIELSPLILFNTNGNVYDIRSNVLTQELIDGQTMRYKVVLDEDMDGVFGGSDKLLKEGAIVAETANQELIISGVEVGQDNLCKLLLVFDSNDNCLCQTAVAHYKGGVIETFPYFICVGAAISLGVEASDSIGYLWKMDSSIACDTCPMNEVIVDFNQVQILELDIISKEGCTAKYQYEIFPSLLPELQLNEEVICLGDSLIVENLYDSMVWAGANIVVDEDRLVAVPNQNTLYKATIIDANGCRNTDSLLVTIEESPVLEAVDTMVCYGASVQLQVKGSSEYEYKWLDLLGQLDDNTTQNPNLLGSTSYDFIVEASLGNCSTTDTLSVTFFDGLDIPSFIDSLVVCQKETTLIELPSGPNYQWVPEYNVECLTSDCAMVEITTEVENLNFVVIGSDENGCKASFDIIVNVVEGDVYSDETIKFCKGETIIYNGIEITQEQQICDTSGINCRVIQCATFEYFEANDNIFFQVEIEKGDLVVLDQHAEYNIYDWEPNLTLSCTDCANPTATPEETTTYILNTVSDFGCPLIIRYEVRVMNACVDPPPLIPNAFTPNGNGENDIFNVSNYPFNGEEIKSFRVYNEWGMMVFESRDNAGWDGKYQGELAPPGYYAYIIEIGCDEDKALIKGGVTLIR